MFTELERAKANRRPYTKAATLAKRFAAKEAFSKAVGTGFKAGVFMKDIGVVNLPSGAPTLALTGGAKARLRRLDPARGHSICASHFDRRSSLGSGVRHIGGPLAVTDETSTETPGVEAAAPAEAAAIKDAGKKAKAEGTDWWAEIRSILLLILAVLGFPASSPSPSTSPPNR